MSSNSEKGKTVGAPSRDVPAAKRFISVQGLAKRWNVSDSTVRRLIDEGELTGIKIRRTFKIGIDSVNDYESRSAF